MNTVRTPSCKTDCVVIDTNIWRYELLLKTPVGVSLVYTLGRQKGTIGLPEVVEDELMRQIVEVGSKAALDLEKSSRIINTLIDSPLPCQIPTEADLKQKVTDRLSELDAIIKRVPFTLEHARSAIEMVNAKLPPNGEKDQQFKDSAIWQSVLTLSETYDVHLVTNDRAFLLDRNDPSKGLAKNLQDDCNRLSVRIGIYCALGECLKAIMPDAPNLNREQFTSLILRTIETPLRDEANRYGLLVGAELQTELDVFQIPTPGRLAVDYTITRICEPDQSFSNDDRNDIRVMVHGSCYWNESVNDLYGNFIQNVTIKWSTATGGHFVSRRSFEGEDTPTPFRRPIVWN